MANDTKTAQKHIGAAIKHLTGMADARGKMAIYELYAAQNALMGVTPGPEAQAVEEILREESLQPVQLTKIDIFTGYSDTLEEAYSNTLEGFNLMLTNSGMTK